MDRVERQGFLCAQRMPGYASGCGVDSGTYRLHVSFMTLREGVLLDLDCNIPLRNCPNGIHGNVGLSLDNAGRASGG